MRKIYFLLAVLLVIIGLPMTVLAAGESAEPTVEPTAASVTFSIDNENIYSGMDRAYKDGYTPTVKDGTATIILPLLTNGNIQNNVITVTPNLGDTSSSPFVYKNYQKTVSLIDNPVGDGTQKVSSYLVKFQLALNSKRTNGVYPVIIEVQALSASGNTVSASFTCYVTINDGTDPNAVPSPEPTIAPQSQPKIIVRNYSISPSTIEAGSEFVANITLENTSTKNYVKNMIVTVTSDSKNFVLLNESNVIYIDKVGKGATTEITLRYKTDLETPPQRYTITLAMEYDNSEATTLSSTGTVMVEVIQPLRVELEAPKVEEQVNAGDTMPLSFQVLNLGRSKVYNVRVELSAPGLIPSGSAFIGNMEAGTSAAADMDVFVGAKNMSEGYEGDDQYGYTNGTFTLIYEDEKGQEYTQKTEFNTTINEPVVAVLNPEVDQEQPETASQWWVSIVIGGIIVAGLITVLVVRSKRKEKEHEEI